MYLEKFTIQNFRAIETLTLEFNKGVNVLIGENNSGKSAIIDGLRICLGYGKQLREIGVKPSDFFINRKEASSKPTEIEFHLHFKLDSDKETAKKERRYFLELIHQEEGNNLFQEIRLHFRYWIEENNRNDDKLNVKWEVWGGTNEGQAVPNEPLQLIGYTFLDALRDATQKLKPYSQNNKLASLFENLIEYKNKNDEAVTLDKNQKKQLAEKLVSWLKDDKDEFNNDWKYLIQEAEKKVKKHFKESVIEDEPTEVEIGFSGYNYRDIVGNLQLSIPLYDKDELQKKGIKQEYFSLSQNGLGENNLIYAATILGDLINRKEKGHYHALLIEEPEAHLHPQKQNTFFQYLNTLSDENIQTFITSHSPTITAKTELDYVTVLQKQNNKISSVALKDISLTNKNKNHLRKFLDVTKSQLFFAKGVILVEGISESLLLPVFARMMDAVDKEKYDPSKNENKEWKTKFNLERKGIELVNVNGVAFEHFAKLFIPKTESDNQKPDCLTTPCSILTDDDSHKNNGSNSDRAKKTEEFHRKGSVIVSLTNRTFEYELFSASEINRKIMRTIYKRLHKVTFVEDGEIDLQFNSLYDGRLEKYKADFALELASCLDKLQEKLKTKFVIPDKIQQAIKSAVNEKLNGTFSKAGED